jgi:hypothetical protein
MPDSVIPPLAVQPMDVDIDLHVLWGSRNRPVPLTWMIGGLGRRGMIVSCVVASALLGLPPAAEPAVVARAFVGV